MKSRSEYRERRYKSSQRIRLLDSKADKNNNVKA